MRVCPLHKNSEEPRTGASAEAGDAARRLRERGSLSIKKFGIAVRAARISEFSHNRFRHPVATSAINQGGGSRGSRGVPQPHESEDDDALLRNTRHPEGAPHIAVTGCFTRAHRRMADYVQITYLGPWE